MTAIITGIKGVLGSALCEELMRRGVDVYGIDVDGWEWNKEPPKTLPGAVFYNLAWIGKAGPLRADWRVQLKNVETSLSYFELAKSMGCARFICAGTIGEKMVESNDGIRLKSQNRFYVNSKNYLHNMLKVSDSGACHVVWATLGNMYGGRLTGNLLDYAVSQLKTGNAALFGPGNQPYDFVNINDAIRALALIGLGDKLTSGEFYIGTGKPRLLKDFLTIVGDIAGRPDLIKIGAKEDDGSRFEKEWFSIENLTAETGYVPEVDFEDGIAQFVSRT